MTNGSHANYICGKNVSICRNLDFKVSIVLRTILVAQRMTTFAQRSTALFRG